MSILTPSDYDEIRAVITTDLKASELNDEVIALDAYQGAAEREVVSIDSSALTRTDADEVALVRSAAVYLTAARLCPAVSRIISIQVNSGSQNYLKSPFNPEKRAAELRQMAHEQLQELFTATTPTIQRPTMFGLAQGRRGK